MLIQSYRTPTQTQVAYVAHWDNVTIADTAEPLQAAQYTDKSVQVFGTFGVGGAVSFQGSSMAASPQDQDSIPLALEYRSASPSSYWGRGSFGSHQAITVLESPEAISSEAPVETQSPTQPESRHF